MIPEPIKRTIEQDIPKMEGWTTPERCVEMAELILETKPKLCVEIGTFGGRTLVAQALALKENGAGTIYGIDPWRVEHALEGENEANRTWWSKNVDLEKIHRGCMEEIWKRGLDQQAVVIRTCSQYCHWLFVDIDVLLIDGNHSEVASCRDVELYLPSVAHGGHVWMDDCDWESTKKAQTLMETQCDVVKDAGHYKLYRKR